jgi:hypothetical protein
MVFLQEEMIVDLPHNTTHTLELGHEPIVKADLLLARMAINNPGTKFGQFELRCEAVE